MRELLPRNFGLNWEGGGGIEQSLIGNDTSLFLGNVHKCHNDTLSGRAGWQAGMQAGGRDECTYVRVRTSYHAAD